MPSSQSEVGEGRGCRLPVSLYMTESLGMWGQQKQWDILQILYSAHNKTDTSYTSAENAWLQMQTCQILLKWMAQCQLVRFKVSLSSRHLNLLNTKYNTVVQSVLIKAGHS